MSLPRMIVAAVVLAVALTWLLIRSMPPSGAEYSSVQRALVGISNAEVKLQSDLLRARGGLSSDYDDIVADMARLHSWFATLRDVSKGEASMAVAEIGAAIDAQEGLVERFKSANALAQNSLAYFTLLSDRLARGGDKSDLAALTGALTASVLQLSRQPTADAIAETDQCLANIGNLAAADLSPDVASLTMHGRLLVELLPVLDGVVRRFPEFLTLKQRGAVRAIFAQRRDNLERSAAHYRFTLYGVAILFLGTLVELGRRLRNGALALRERARVEHRLSEISNVFIGCQPEDIRSRIRDSLEALGKSAQSNRTYLLLIGEEPDLLIWSRPDVASPPGWPGVLADVVPALAEASGDVFSTADFAPTPPPAVMALLERYGVPRWSCVKLFDQEEFLGLLVFERAVDVAPWYSDMTSPLRLTGITMSNALHRERLAQHRMALQEKVQRAKRLETVGLFSSGIAHNFNNLLGVMLGHAEILTDQPGLPALVRQHARSIAETGERAGALVQSILNYGRRSDGVRRPVAMGALAIDTVALLSPSLPVRIECDIRVPDGDVFVSTDPTQMQQVLVNLIRNAAQASEAGTPVTVSVETLSLARRRKLSHGVLRPKSYVRVCVADRGVGITAEAQAKLFQPFFTTRPAGTGLGLATAAEVVRDLGGAFDLDSTPGQGTSFAFWLPLDDAEGRASPVVPVGNGETVLVVSTKCPRVRQFEDMLAGLGYEPVSLASGGSALEAVRSDPKRFDLVLIADNLVDMAESDLASAIRQTDERLPLVLLRSEPDDGRTGRRSTAPFDHVSTVPRTPAELAAVMTWFVRRSGSAGGEAGPKPSEARELVSRRDGDGSGAYH